MAQVAVVTDNMACLPPQLVRAFNISTVPVYIHYQGKGYRDGVDVKAEDVYSWIQSSNKLPTSSPPPPADFIELFKRLDDKDIICITVSSKLSSVFNSARLAKESISGLLNKDIKVVDSRTACMAQGFLVLRAAEEAASGKSLEQILTKVNSLIPKVRMMGMIDRFDYLVKGGKVPKAVGWLTSLLQIKPIIGIEDGEFKLLARTRTKRKALEKMLEIVGQSEGDNLHIAIHYTYNDPTTALEMKEELLKLEPAEIYITPFSPIMGMHAGPGFIGLAFYKD